VQTDTARQPKIVDGGALVTQGGLAAINFDSSSKHFNMASIGFGNTWSMFAVINATGLNSKILSQSSFSGGAPRIDLEQGSPDQFEIVSNSYADADKMNLAGNINTRALTSLIDSANSFTAFTNGLPSSENPTTINGSFTFSVIGSQAAQVHQELILYNSDQTDNRTALEANIGEVYGIAGIPAYDDTVNGFVETWYDQSGNGNDATQLTAGSQPKIVNAGTLVTGGLNFDGTNDSLETSLVPPNVATLIGVANWDIENQATMIIGARDSANKRSYLSQTGAGVSAVGVANNVLVGVNVVAGNDYLLLGIHSGSTRLLSTNGNVVSSSIGTAPNNTVHGYSIGALNTAGTDGLFMDGTIQEVIVYASNQSANRLAIEANINNQYDIY
jgi:hypothetical protein